MNRTPVFSGIQFLPSGQASHKLSSGCIVLEGGAFRGVYTSGVLDEFPLSPYAHVEMVTTSAVSPLRMEVTAM